MNIPSDEMLFELRATTTSDTVIAEVISPLPTACFFTLKPSASPSFSSVMETPGDLLPFRRCSEPGLIYEYGRGTTQDNREAIVLYQKTCYGDYALGCSNLGHMYEHDKGIARDVQQAGKLYRQGCNGRSDYRCETSKDLGSKHP